VCMSAEMSFAASATLAVVGGACLWRARAPGERILATMPLLFALQQAAEGWLWLTRTSPGTFLAEPLTEPLAEPLAGIRAGIWADTAGAGGASVDAAALSADLSAALPANLPALFFLLFAYVLWPAYAPYCLHRAEGPTTRIRAALFWSARTVGLATGLFFLWRLPTSEAAVAVVGNSLQYQLSYPWWLAAHMAYGYATLCPAFYSRARSMHLFGVLLVVGHLTALYAYRATYPSVFCLFAALASLTLWLRIRFGARASAA